MTDELRRAAVDWAARGFKVFRLVPGAKNPMRKAWYDEATDDQMEVHALWSDPVTGWARPYNIGVDCSTMIVVDADVKNGKPGIASFASLDLPLQTLMVDTPTGGFHAYYSGPPRANSSETLAPGIDTRGVHGYVIAPGSELDPSIPSNKGVGGFYTLKQDAALAEAPMDFVLRLGAPRERSESTTAVQLDQPDTLLRAIQFLESEAPLAIENAGGDLTTFKVACVLKDMGVSVDVALRLMADRWLGRCAFTWSPESAIGWLENKIANAYEYGKMAPGSGSPEAEFAGLDLPDDLPSPLGDQAVTPWFHHGDTWDTNVRWLFYEMLEAKGVVGMIGPPNGGKTFLMLELARCLATGAPFFGTPPDDIGGTAFLFGGTEGGGLPQRLAALNEEGRLPIAGCRIPPLGIRGALDTLASQLRAFADAMQAEHGVPLRLVVLETLSASGLVEDENDNAKVAIAITALAALGQRLGVLVAFTHHPTKDGRAERGAGAIRGNSDYIMEITRDNPQSPIRDVDLTKARNAPQRRLGAFTLLPVTLGQDDRGRPVVSCMVSQAQGEKAPSAGPAFSEMLVQCVEFALISDGTTVDGVEAVEVDEVKALFKDRKTGSRDRGNISRAFSKALAFAEETGAVRTIASDGRKYLTLPFGD